MNRSPKETARPSAKARLGRFLIELGRAIFKLRKREELRFPIRFLAWATLLWFAADVGLLRPGIRALQAGTSQLVVGSALLTGLSAQSQPQSVVSFGAGSFSYWISEGCTAWAVGLLYVSAILAYPAGWRRRGLGILIGLPLILGLNVLRLVSMAWLGVAWPSMYEQAHGLWWQALVILGVGLGWLAWARFVEAERQGRPVEGRVKELAIAIAVFLAVIVAAGFVAAWTTVGRAYGAFLMASASAVSDFLFNARSDFFFSPDSLDFESSRHLGGMVGTVALYAATPRLPFRLRAVGIVACGIPFQFLLDCLALAVRQAVLVDEIGRADDALRFAQILAWGGSAVVWYLFAKRHWIAALRKRPAVACPECAEVPLDLLGHLESAHANRARRLRRRLVRAHPHLERAWLESRRAAACARVGSGAADGVAEALVPNRPRP